MDPYDDPEINDQDTAIRRINPAQSVVFDHNEECNGISSKAFSPSSGQNGGMSVDLLAPMEEDGVNAKEFVTTPVFTGSVAFEVGDARHVNFWIGKHPLDDNPYHGEIWGNPVPNRISRSQKRALLNASSWFVEIPDVSLVK